MTPWSIDRCTVSMPVKSTRTEAPLCTDSTRSLFFHEDVGIFHILAIEGEVPFRVWFHVVASLDRKVGGDNPQAPVFFFGDSWKVMRRFSHVISSDGESCVHVQLIQGSFGVHGVYQLLLVPEELDLVGGYAQLLLHLLLDVGERLVVGNPSGSNRQLLVRPRNPLSLSFASWFRRT